MEEEKPFTADDLTLEAINTRFSTEDKARAYLESLRWPEGPTCPHCQNQAQHPIYRIQENREKKIRAGLYKCTGCNKQFTVTVGTIFEDSHIPLRKWLVAFYMVSSSKKGVSALQMQRMLGIGSYRTAHFMMHRIRYALKAVSFNKPLAGTVELDEAFIGGKPRIEFIKGNATWITKPKIPVVSLVERGGNVRSVVMDKLTAKNLREAVEEHVSENTALITDSASRLKNVGGKNRRRYRVNHAAKQYTLKVNEKFTAHTNTVESTFSLLKRGVYGTFHHISRQHLPLYLAEFDHRWNYRDQTDGARTVAGILASEGKRLTYHKPKSGKGDSILSHEGQ